MCSVVATKEFAQFAAATSAAATAASTSQQQQQLGVTYAHAQQQVFAASKVNKLFFNSHRTQAPLSLPVQGTLYTNNSINTLYTPYR